MNRRALLRAAVLIPGLSAGIASCRDPVRICSPSLEARFTPRDTTIAVGRSFHAVAESRGGCDTGFLPMMGWWVSQHPAVATSDSATATIVGRGPGDAVIDYMVVPGSRSNPEGPPIRVGEIRVHVR